MPSSTGSSCSFFLNIASLKNHSNRLRLRRACRNPGHGPSNHDTVGTLKYLDPKKYVKQWSKISKNSQKGNVKSTAVRSYAVAKLKAAWNLELSLEGSVVKHGIGREL